ncbi:hypothetical protein ACFLZ4_00380 [Patescibacteria group bacterium]
MKSLEDIAKIREEKGKEDEALKYISEAIKEVSEKDDMETLAKLYWESSLVHQHLVMTEKSSDLPDENIVQKETLEMGKAALKAHKIIKENNIEDLKAISHRFLGRVNTYKGNHIRAQKEYKKSIELIRKQENKEQLLELNAFLAPTLVVNGKVQEGIDLALKTFDDFETTDMGKALKERDYYVWAAWRSGIPSRMILALQEADVEIEKEKWESILNTCENFLKNPQGETWGDFQFRLDEVKKSRSILEKLATFCLVIIPGIIESLFKV